MKQRSPWPSRSTSPRGWPKLKPAQPSSASGLHTLPSPVTAAAAVQELITGCRPDVVITHPLADAHPDHRQVAAAVLAALPEAVISTGHPKRGCSTDTYNSLTLHGPLHAAVIVDITAAFEIKTQALAADGGTQPVATRFGPMAETLGRLWGARIGVPYAEAFAAIPVLGRLPTTARLRASQAAQSHWTGPSQEEPDMPPSRSGPAQPEHPRPSGNAFRP